MAASTDGSLKTEDDASFSSPPGLSKLASDQDVEISASTCSSIPTVNGIICREVVVGCNAQSAAASSPMPVQGAHLLDQEPMDPGGEAPYLGSLVDSESNLTSEATGMSLPPMVDSVTVDMLKISINHALCSTEENIHLANGGSGHAEGHEMSMLIRATVDDDDSSRKEAGVETKLLSSNGHPVVFKNDALSLQANNFLVGANNSANSMPGSLSKDACELGSSKDAHRGDVGDGEEEEEAAGNGIDIDDDEEDDDTLVEVKQDSDSSSSTSSLSFLGSSSDDDAYDDEVQNLNRLLNSANNLKDLMMVEESECEEGELKEPPSQRNKKGGLKKKTVNENSEDEEGWKESARSRKKEKDLPLVPKVSVALREYHRMVPVGFVSSVVGISLIVEGLEGQQALTEGSIFWLTDKRLPLGIVDELFGPVKKPFYVVRYNDVTEMPEGAREGAQVSYVLDFADFFLQNPALHEKGYDESGDEGNSDSEVNFSDDEKEAEYRRSISRTKRGNSESYTLEVGNRQGQERRTGGKCMKRENKNWRSRGESDRDFQSNHDSGRRPPRHQNARIQRQGNERDRPYTDMVEPVQTSNLRNRSWHGNKSPARQAKSQQSFGVGQSKPLTPVELTSDDSVPFLTQVQVSNLNSLQSTSSPILSELTVNTNQSCDSRPCQTNQFLHNSPQQAQLQMCPQPSSQQVQLQHSNQPCNLLQLPPQQIQMSEPHGLNKPTLPQVMPWQARQPQGPLSQSPCIQQPQMPVYSHAVVAGCAPQAAIGGCSITLPNKPPLQPGADMAQGLPLAYQSSIYQQQAPILNQFSSSMVPPFSGQVPPNMGMPTGNQIQALPTNGFPVGVQSAALDAPVLGIPIGQANFPFSYPIQMFGNQNFSGFTPAFANSNQVATYGVPDQARPMQPLVTTSWQHPPQDSSVLPSQRPFHGRPHQTRGPHQGRRF